jgi:hypothetical protein
MKTRAILSPLLLLLLLPVAVRAQEEDYQRGKLMYVQTVKVTPAHAAAYEAAVGKIVKAAEMAKLGPGYKWAFMNDMFTYTLVYPFSDFAYWDDPEQWMRQFKGTEGEATLQEAFQEFGKLDTRVVMSEVVEHVEDWSYQPEKTREDATMAHFTEFWLKSGKEEQFTEVTKEIMGFFKKLGYGYEVSGHRVHFGDTDRRVFVTWYDDRGSFYGANSLDALIEKKGMGEKWGELMSRMSELIVDGDHSDSELKQAMTYWPEMEKATH